MKYSFRIAKGLSASLMIVLIACPVTTFALKIPDRLKRYIEKKDITKEIIDSAKKDAINIFRAIREGKEAEAQNHIKEALRHASESVTTPFAFQILSGTGKSMLHEAINKGLESLIIPLAILGGKVGIRDRKDLLDLAKQKGIKNTITDALSKLLNSKQKLQLDLDKTLSPQIRSFYDQINSTLKELSDKFGELKELGLELKEESLRDTSNENEEQEAEDAQEHDWVIVEKEDEDSEFVEPEEQQKSSFFSRIGQRLGTWK